MEDKHICPPEEETGNNIKISRRATEERLANVEERRRRRERSERFFRIALLLILTAFIVVGIIGARQKAPWYTQTFAPTVDKIVTWCRATTGTASAPSDDNHASEGDMLLPTYREGEGEVDDWYNVIGNKNGTDVENLTETPGVTQSQENDLVSTAGKVNTATRPRPTDLDFSNMVPQVRAHVMSQPSQYRRLEADHVTHVSRAREHLIMLMRFIPYETGSRGILLNTGTTTAPGTVVGANERGFLFHPRNGVAKTLDWEDISIAQYVAFFQFYIARRVGAIGQADWEGLITAGQQASRRNRKDAAGECLLTGLLCDWYGNPEMGRKFLRLALIFDRSSEAQRFLK